LSDQVTLRDRIYENICNSGGLGNSRIASGTVGSFPAVIIYLLIAYLAPSAYHDALIACMLLISCALCVALGPWAEKRWNKKDPRNVVLDEYAGFFLTVLLFRTPNILLTAVWTFLMTRILDIIKPPPASNLEFLPKGWGILVDDLVASLYAVGALYLLKMFFPVLFAA
jgi:phosphatidylglycerophosphatase A